MALAAATVLLVASFSTSNQSASPQLVLRATYDTVLGANAAAIISVRRLDAIAAMTHVAGFVDVLDLSNPLRPRLIVRP